MGGYVTDGGRCGAVDWAVCASPYPGQARSGDAFLVQAIPDGVLVAVVDGLGHGQEAADVAERAVECVRASAGQPLLRGLTACHTALRGSRGVVMTLVAVHARSPTLGWLAVGNVDAAVLRPGRRGGPVQRWSVPLRGGVVGDRLPPLRELPAPLAVGDTLVAATDGMAPGMLDGIDLSPEVADLARGLHGRHAGTGDDALVLVARRSSWP
ncbi:MAG: SpoIIE family protein phosphatase [Acidimicrobiales bacterium]